MSYYNISEIDKHKKSDTAIFLGSGSSINNIIKDQWDIISKHDTWAINNWIYHPTFVPTFYHLELKPISYDIFKERKKEKNDLYKDVVFIVNRKRMHIAEAIQVVGDQKYIYLYDMLKLDEQRIERTSINYQFSNNKNILTCVCGVSMTMLFELWYRIGYKKIVLLGCDMKDSLYFWSDHPEYGKTHCHHNKDHEGKKQGSPHNTSHLKSFIIAFRDQMLKPKGSNIYVGYTNTMLYPEIEYHPIEEL